MLFFQFLERSTRLVRRFAIERQQPLPYGVLSDLVFLGPGGSNIEQPVWLCRLCFAEQFRQTWVAERRLRIAIPYGVPGVLASAQMCSRCDLAFGLRVKPVLLFAVGAECAPLGVAKRGSLLCG